MLSLIGLFLPYLLSFTPPAQAQRQSLIATQDTYLRRFSPDRNQGGLEILRVLALARNRCLVQFDQQAIATAVAGRTIVSAKLRLNIAQNLFLGNTGREVAVHRMTQSWTELGATWNCPDDTDTSNRRPDCTRWNMRNSSQWPFVVTPTAAVLHRNGQSGAVEWDVTPDVAQFLAGTADNFGWIVKKVKELKPGRVKYSSRDGALCEGKRSQLPAVRRYFGPYYPLSLPFSCSHPRLRKGDG